MKIKWEKNSRVLGLASQGKINQEDIVPRSRTDEFLDEVATVRMSSVREKDPFLTIHIRGPLRHQKKPWGTYKYASTKSMCSNGDLSEAYSWQDVHNVVEEVKEVMSL